MVSYVHTKEYLKAWRERSREYLMFKAAKYRAKKKNLEFTIELKDIVIPKVCPVLNIPLEYNFKSGFHNNSPSLDRIDSSKGYIKNNVRVISNRANRLKCDATLKELEALVLDARSHRY